MHYNLLNQCSRIAPFTFDGAFKTLMVIIGFAPNGGWRRERRLLEGMYEIHYVAEEHSPWSSSSNLHELITMRHSQGLTIYWHIMNDLLFNCSEEKRGGAPFPKEWGVSPLAVSSLSLSPICLFGNTHFAIVIENARAVPNANTRAWVTDALVI